MSENGESFDLELERIRKSLGLDTKSALRSEVDEFLGRAQAGSKAGVKVPNYEPFFPFDAVGFYRHISEGLSSPTRDYEIGLIEDFQSAPEGSAAKTHALNELLKAFIRLVIHHSRQFLKSGLDQDEIVQEGIFGLIRAAEKADMSLGNRFSTYAGHWIDQSAAKFVGNHSRLIRIPIHGHDVIRRAKAINRSDFLHGRPPKSLEKIEVELDLSPGSLRKLLEADSMVISLEEWQKNNDEVDSYDLQTHIEELELERDLSNALEFLHPREAGVLRSRYGLNSGEAMTLEEVGEKFGVTRERIRQVEKKALDNLRNGPYSEKLRAHAGLSHTIKTHQIKMQPPVETKIKVAPRLPMRKRIGPSNQERVSAAALQTIIKIREALDLLGANVSEELRAAGELRIMHPDRSLSDLGRLSTPPISKDAYAGRLRRLLDSMVRVQARSSKFDRGDKTPATPAYPEIEGEIDLDLTDEMWTEIVRKTELALLISGGRVSNSEKSVSDWVLERKLMPVEMVVREAGGKDGLLTLLEKLRFMIGDARSQLK